MKWKLGNGKKVKFWNDCWYKPGVLLRDVAVRPLNDLELKETVSDFVLLNGDWNREKLKWYLLDNICIDICRLGIITGDLKEDTIVWNYPKEIKFSVESAYMNLSKEPQLRAERQWDLISKWPGNQRNKTFMWLCTKNKS